MTQVLASCVVIGCISAGAFARQPQGAAGAGKPAIRACALLTKELVTKVSPQPNKQLLFMVPPTEDSLGATGSACQYGGIMLQIDPFTPVRLDVLYKEHRKEWTVVTGTGDAAYFRDNDGRYAELFVRAGSHVFTIQMSVPVGATVASIKPNAVALAKAIEPKLR